MQNNETTQEIKKNQQANLPTNQKWNLPCEVHLLNTKPENLYIRNRKLNSIPLKRSHQRQLSESSFKLSIQFKRFRVALSFYIHNRANTILQSRTRGKLQTVLRLAYFRLSVNSSTILFFLHYFLNIIEYCCSKVMVFSQKDFFVCVLLIVYFLLNEACTVTLEQINGNYA